MLFWISQCENHALNQFYFTFIKSCPLDLNMVVLTNTECGYPEIKCNQNDWLYIYGIISSTNTRISLFNNSLGLIYQSLVFQVNNLSKNGEIK